MSDPTWTDVVDLDVLRSWMDDHGLGRGGAISNVSPLAGGTQNVMLRFERGGATYVLRRGPRHLRPTSNDALRREARVLAALEGTDVAHPALIAACDDESVMGGAVFYLMTAVDGFNPTMTLPSPHANDPAVRHAMGLAAADAIARLGRLDHLAIGLGDVGKPDGFLERQVRRWLDELASYDRFEGYDGPNIPGVEKVAAWLDANRPAGGPPGVIHGDYHLANLMYRFDGPTVAAIVDWEMCTIGDPLLDLGWLLATWPDPDGSSPGLPGLLAAAGGLPDRYELVAAYAAASPRDVGAVDWYEVLACFKLGIVLEGTNARAAAGRAPKATGDLLHAITLGLFERAVRRIA